MAPPPKHKPRTFEIRPAERLAGNIKVGLFAPSGGGKTFSALRLAKGIQSIVGGDIGVVDTENRRATHYSNAFKFHHIDFRPPFGSEDYADAIRSLEKAGCRVIIVDSMSHEHDGPGGMLEFHEAEVDRLAGADANWQRRESVKMLAWKEPKGARRRLLRAIVESNANLILCFRAKESAKPVVKTDDQGRKKTEVVQLGFVPIAGDEFVFEMDLAALLLPAARGVATWSSDQPGERMMIKVPDQFARIAQSYAEKPLDEELGANLARWAMGGTKPAAPAAVTGTAGAAEESTKGSERPGDEPPPDDPPAQEEPAEPEASATQEEPATDGGDLFAGDDTGDNTSTTLEPVDSKLKLTPDEPPNPWAQFGEDLAASRSWAEIERALSVLGRAVNLKVEVDRGNRARTLAWHRWKELEAQKVDTGLKDFLDAPHAFRCYIEVETDPDAILGNLRAFEATPRGRALPGEAKAAFQEAAQRRMLALNSNTGAEFT